MASINFTQKELSGSATSGIEMDRYILQGDKSLLNPESLLKSDINSEVSEVSAGVNSQFLRMVLGSPSFESVTTDMIDSIDFSGTQNGHILLGNGLILNWQTHNLILALASVTLNHSKSFSLFNFGTFVSVVDLNNVSVSVISETNSSVTLKNFDSINSASTVKIFSIGI